MGVTVKFGRGWARAGVATVAATPFSKVNGTSHRLDFLREGKGSAKFLPGAFGYRLLGHTLFWVKLRGCQP